MRDLPATTPPPALLVSRCHDGALLGRVFVLDRGAVRVGRSPAGDVVLPQHDVAPFHCSFEPRGGVWWVIDRGSTVGTTLGGERVLGAPLADGDEVFLGPVGLRFFAGEGAVERARREAEGFRARDPLTGALPRQAALDLLARLIEGARAASSALSLICLDLDRLGPFNEQHGGGGGDQALAGVARWVRGALLPGEALGRHRGGAFLVLCPAPAADARRRAGVLCDLIRARTLEVNDGLARVTARAGVAELAPGDDAPSLLARAERLVARAPG